MKYHMVDQRDAVKARKQARERHARIMLALYTSLAIIGVVVQAIA